MKTTTLDIDLDTTTRRPLLYIYPQQQTAQPAYLYLDEGGQVFADWDGEIGNGTSERIWNNCDLRWPLHNELTGDQIAKLIEEVTPLLEIVYSGHTVEWNGNNNQGRLTPIAIAAVERLERICGDLEPEAWDYDNDGDHPLEGC